MSDFFRKASVYWGVNSWIHGGVGEEQSDTDWEQSERYDFVSADGTRSSYHVGNRSFIERTFRFQTDAQIAAWRSFFTDWAGKGKAFYYYDDSPVLYGAGYLFGAAGLYFGGSSVGVLVVLENTDFRPEREEVSGYWTITLLMRKVP